MTSKTCHRCSYDLTGLPQEHQCPECGLSYDGHSRAWTLPFSPTRLAFLLLIGLPILIPLVDGRSRGVCYSMFHVLMGAPLLVMAWIYSWRGRRGFVVSLHPQGVYLRKYFFEGLIPWQDIHDVERVHGTGLFLHRPRLRLRLINGRVEVLDMFFKWNDDRVTFADAFRRAQRRYAKVESGDVDRACQTLEDRPLSESRP